MPEPPDEKSKSFNVLKSILNAVDAFICVTVPETGEILFLNDRLIKNYGLENDGAGQLCYKLLRNQDGRCEECPYHQLEKEPGKTVIWEQYEPLANRTFRKIGMYIDWPGGKTAHLEYGFDITDILQIQSELERRIAMADALNKTLEIFCAHKEKTFDEVMTTGLRPVADIMEIDRIIVYRHTEVDGLKWPEQIYHWDKGNRQLGEKSFGILRNLEVFSGWTQALEENRCVNQTAEDMSEAQAAFVKQYGLKSILMIPIFLHGQLWGSVNFQDHTRGRKFEDQAVELMRAVANTCASAIIRAQAEREAASANEFNRMLFSTAPVGFLLFDENLNFIDCNDYLAAMFGVSKTDYLKRFYDLSPGYQTDGVKSEDKAREIMKRTLQGEKVATEWLHISPEGEIVPCDIRTTLIKSGDKYLGIAYVYDLRHIRKLERSLIEAEERVRLILDSTPLCCELWDRNMEALDCNEAALMFYGLKNKREYLENFGDFWPEYQPQGSLSREKARSYLTKALAEGGAAYEWTARFSDGSPIPARVILSRLKHRDDHIVVAYTVDMREHKRLVDEIEAALFKAEEASRAKTEFMSRVSHEMLTPMNAIMGMAQVIKMQYQDKELNEYADIIVNASQDMLKMIKNVLDMSSLEFGALKLEMADFSLKDIFEAVREGLARHLAKKGQTFKTYLDPSIPERLFGDEKQLSQVLNHLLKNAIKFTPDGGEVGFKAQVRSREKEDVILQFEITDNGIGMTREQQEKLFEIFEQVNGTFTRKYDGLGLGLAYSRRLIELMGGQIGVDSELGRGTRFTFTCRFKSR